MVYQFGQSICLWNKLLALDWIQLDLIGTNSSGVLRAAPAIFVSHWEHSSGWEIHQKALHGRTVSWALATAACAGIWFAVRFSIIHAVAFYSSLDDLFNDQLSDFSSSCHVCTRTCNRKNKISKNCYPLDPSIYGFESSGHWSIDKNQVNVNTALLFLFHPLTLALR